MAFCAENIWLVMIDTGSGLEIVSVEGKVLECCFLRRLWILQRHLVRLSNMILIIPDISSGWDLHDTVYSRELLISNKANGYRDIIASIDLSSYRRIPWEDNAPFFLVSFFNPDTEPKQPLVVDPRGILKITSDRAKMLGRECFAGCEYEVSIFVCILHP